MLNNLNQLEQHDYTNNYFIGTVVDNNDPDKLERVRVTIPQLYESSDTSLLPWIAPAHGRGMLRGEDFGSFGVPPVGTFLIVILQDGDPQYPLYIGSVLINGYQLDLAGVNYPNRYGLKDTAGNFFFVDTSSGEVHFEHKSGTKLIIDDSGDVTVHVEGTITSDATDTWTHTGNLSLVGNLDVTGSVHSTDNIESDAAVLANDRGTTISLSKHVHEGVRGGDDRTQEPALVPPGDLP